MYGIVDFRQGQTACLTTLAKVKLNSWILPVTQICSKTGPKGALQECGILNVKSLLAV